jgi:murein DD-endopeptidase MepM/ murein hydrolase activator NlpD
MRLSTLAALMILTTIMLSACSQQNMAQLEDKSGQYYGRDTAMASASYSATTNTSSSADVIAVETVDLAPPTTAKPANSTTLAATQPASNAAMRWQWPVDGRVNYQQASNGIVIQAAEGTPIHAAADGKVVFDGMDATGFGRMAILRHEDGSMTSYAHAQEILVSTGDDVNQGDLIGYVGRTGDAASPQLHFGMKQQGHAVNPASVLPQQMAAL